VDELILIDISGSMVQDIRAALVMQGMATANVNKGYYPAQLKNVASDDFRQPFRLSSGLTIESALGHPKMQAVVTNNPLYKVLRYVEQLIDEPGLRRVYLALFDNGPQDFELVKAPNSLHRDGNIVGPFLLEDVPSLAESNERRRLKNLLVRDQADPQRTGILPRAVLLGEGPTALHATCLLGYDFLKALKLGDGNYSNVTSRQRMVVFTDGKEEKDMNKPFSSTVAALGLQRTNSDLEFRKIFTGIPQKAKLSLNPAVLRRI
jgi:hypothetical protein